MLAVIVVSCNQKELEQLREENAKLKNEQSQNEEALYEFAQSFNSIQSNFDSIMVKEGLVTKITTSGEKSKSAQEIVNDQVNAIYDLLLKNREEMEKLRRKSGQLSKKNKDLEMIIERLNRELEEKVVEIEMLRGQLAQMQYQITGLNEKVDSLGAVTYRQKQVIENQQTKITEQDSALNTVFYAIGTEKELKANGVITKDGGFLGVGKSNKVTNDLNLNYFQSVDKRKFHSLKIGAKKVTLSTPHPTGSYQLHGDKVIDSLTVVDPEQFWRNSRYLVIIIKH